MPVLVEGSPTITGSNLPMAIMVVMVDLDTRGKYLSQNARQMGVLTGYITNKMLKHTGSSNTAVLSVEIGTCYHQTERRSRTILEIFVSNSKRLQLPLVLVLTKEIPQLQVLHHISTERHPNHY